MRERRVFHLNVLDLLEDRLVPSSLSAAEGPAAVRGPIHLQRSHQARGIDVTGITNQINQAFAAFARDVQGAIAATNFTAPPPVLQPPFIPTPVSNPSVENLLSVVLQRVGTLNQEISTILMAVPGASRGLLAQAQDEILGIGPGSLSLELASAVNSAQNTSSPFPPFVTQVNVPALSAQVGNLISAARLAVTTDVAIFAGASSTGPRHQAGRQSLGQSLQLMQIPNLIGQAFASFMNDYFSAAGQFGLSPFSPFPGSTTQPPAAVLEAFQTATLQRVPLLALDVSNLLAPVPGAARLVPLVQNQIAGPDPGSLLRTLATTPYLSTTTFSDVSQLISAAQAYVTTDFNLFNSLNRG